MSSFFVEFRFHGYPKHYLRGLINELAHKFRVKGAIKYRPVPHMTLYGSSQTASMSKVFAAIERVGKRYPPVLFKVEGFGWFDGKEGKVIHAGIATSPKLEKLRWELAEELRKIPTTPQSWDTLPGYKFHTTIAMKDIDRQFEDIWNYVNKKEKPRINQHLVRITVLNKDRKILRECDLMLKRWLNRQQALSGYWWRRTVSRLMEYQGLPPEKPTSLTNRLRRMLKWFGQ